MSTQQSLESWKPFEECKKILAEKGEARVYFVSVECRGLPGMRETRKMSKWLDKRDIGTVKSFAELVKVPCAWVSAEDVYVPAIKATIKSAEEFAAMWWSLSKLTNSSCGCSLMVNDAQGFDVRVMETDTIAFGERRAY